jgi:hypothetical protein
MGTRGPRTLHAVLYSVAIFKPDFAERSKDFSGWSLFFCHHDEDILVLEARIGDNMGSLYA